MDKNKILNLRNCETEIDMYFDCLDKNTHEKKCTDVMILYLKCLDKSKNELLNKTSIQEHSPAYIIVKFFR